MIIKKKKREKGESQNFRETDQTDESTLELITYCSTSRWNFLVNRGNDN